MIVEGVEVLAVVVIKIVVVDVLRTSSDASYTINGTGTVFFLRARAGTVGLVRADRFREYFITLLSATLKIIVQDLDYVGTASNFGVLHVDAVNVVRTLKDALYTIDAAGHIIPRATSKFVTVQRITCRVGSGSNRRDGYSNDEGGGEELHDGDVDVSCFVFLCEDFLGFPIV